MYEGPIYKEITKLFSPDTLLTKKYILIIHMQRKSYLCMKGLSLMYNRNNLSSLLL